MSFSSTANKSIVTQRGFSLLELLVVILILGILAAFVAPNLIGKGEEAKRDLVCVQMNSAGQALDMFKLDNGVYPETEEGLQALAGNPDPEKYPNYSGASYMKSVPKDSWQNPFGYLKNEGGFDLISFGADRKEGGNGDAEDIFFSKCNK